MFSSKGGRPIERIINVGREDIFSIASCEQLVDLALSHIGEVSYFHLANHGFRPNGIIDIGAYQGEWSRSIARVYPDVPILMIEALPEKKPQLEAIRALLPHVEIELSLLGIVRARMLTSM